VNKERDGQSARPQKTSRGFQETLIGDRALLDLSNRAKYLSGMTMSELADITGAIELDAFLASYNHPFLVQIANIKSKKNMEEMLSTDHSMLSANELEYDLTDCPVFFVKKNGAGEESAAEEIVVGRAKDNDICLDFPTVSKVHATIRVEKGRGLIIDNDSKNGTFLGSKRLDGQQKYPISPGQTIDFSENLSFLYLGPSTVFTYLKNVSRAP
jgi:hypothetical protein